MDQFFINIDQTIKRVFIPKFNARALHVSLGIYYIALKSLEPRIQGID